MKLLLWQIADRFGKIPLGIEIMTTISPNLLCRISVLLPSTSPVLIPAHMVVKLLGHRYVHVQIDHIIPNCFPEYRNSSFALCYLPYLSDFCVFASIVV